MLFRPVQIAFAAFVLILLAAFCPAHAGMIAVDDGELASVQGKTGINLYGNLKATAGNLIISGTAGSMKLGGWHLNNSTTADTNPTSGDEGFSQWGPFSYNVGYYNAIGRAVLRIGLDARVNNNAPTWIFKSIQIWDPLKAGGADWQDIGGLYLTTIHLWETYLDFFNDVSTTSTIRAFGQFAGSIERATIQWGPTYGEHCIRIPKVEFGSTLTSQFGGATGFMTIGDMTSGGWGPLRWDYTSAYGGTAGNYNMRLFFPFQGSLAMGTTTDPLQIRSHPGGAGANYTRNLGIVRLNNLKGQVTIDFPQQTSPAVSWWNY